MYINTSSIVIIGEAKSDREKGGKRKTERKKK